MAIEFVYKRPFLYPKQLAALFGPARFALCEASTKAGKTHGTIVWLLEQAFQGGPGKNYWWVAPVNAQARMAWERMKRAIPQALYTANKTPDMTITLGNGSVIWFKSAERPDGLFGEDVYAAVIDEATRCREASWNAVFSTLTATNGLCRIIGNVRGTKNWVAKLARLARAEIERCLKSGEACRYHYAKLTCWDAVEAGVLDRIVVETARLMLPTAVFRELFEGIPAEDGGNPFGLQHIEKVLREGTRIRADGVVEYPDGKGGWEPDQAPYAWGWDIAKYQDWTVGVGLSKTGRVVRFVRWQGVDLMANADKIIAYTGSVPAMVDTTHGSIGDGLMDVLRHKGKGHIFEPFQFTGTTKQPLMEGLAMRIQEHKLEIPDGVMLDELVGFEFQVTRTHVTYGAPEGEHDDCVCALALAVKKLQAPRAVIGGASMGAH